MMTAKGAAAAKPAAPHRQPLTHNRINTPIAPGQAEPNVGPLTGVERADLLTREHIISKGLETVFEVGAALEQIRDQRLYRETHKTFEDYCQQRWHITSRRARQLCAAADVRESLDDGTIDIKLLPSTESQARVLAPLPVEQRKKVYGELLEIPRQGPPTAKEIAQALRPAQASPKKEAESKWVQPSAFGVFNREGASNWNLSDKGEKFFGHIWVLQIDDAKWISCLAFKFLCGSHNEIYEQLRPDSEVFPDGPAALQFAAARLVNKCDGIFRSTGSTVTDAQRKAAQRLREWARNLTRNSLRNIIAVPQRADGREPDTSQMASITPESRAPLHTEPLIITTKPHKGGGYDWVAFSTPPGGRSQIKSTSTSSAESAAFSLAMKWFWGGNTQAVISDEQRDRVTIKRIKGARFMATLESPKLPPEGGVPGVRLQSPKSEPPCRLRIATAGYALTYVQQLKLLIDQTDTVARNLRGAIEENLEELIEIFKRKAAK